MKQFAIALVGSMLTAAYWWIVFTIVYAHILLAGDRNPAAQPPLDSEVLTRSIMTLVVGVFVYALAAILWRRLTSRSRSVTR